jgi:uncharacterized membrane protein
MNREQFFSQLKRALGRIPESEKREILADYEEHFRMGASEGKAEAEIAQALGNPRSIGGSYRIDSILEETKEGAGISASSVLRAVFASSSLTIFNAIFVLGPFCGLVAVMVSLWAVAASLALAGVAVILGTIAAPILPQYITLGGVNPAFAAFAGIGAAALGLLAGIGMWKLTRMFLIMIAGYVKFNVRIVTRKK